MGIVLQKNQKHSSIERELHEDSRLDFKLHNVIIAQQFHKFIFIHQHLNRLSRKRISKAVFNYTPIERILVEQQLSEENMEGI